MIELTATQQSVVRLALGSEIATLKRMREGRTEPWAYGDQQIAQLETILEMLYRGDIFIGYRDEFADVPEQTFEEMEATCDRCGYRDCACGDPEFEAHNAQELNRASEVD